MVEVSSKGVFGNFLAKYGPSVQISMESAAKRIVDRLMDKAKENYLQKRMSTDPHSNIISSFRYIQEKANSTEVVGYFAAGGPTAPYIIYVEQLGWRTKSGHKEGYHFMKTSFEQVKAEVPTIVKEEFGKIFHTV